MKHVEMTGEICKRKIADKWQKGKNSKRVEKKKWQYEKKTTFGNNSDKKRKEDKEIKEIGEKNLKQTKENAKNTLLHRDGV